MGSEMCIRDRYDLLVNIEKVDNPSKVSLPQFPVLSSPVNVGVDKKK